MINLNKSGIAPYIALSVVVHIVVFFMIFYRGNNKNLFIQVPFEVSFYSPAQDIISEPPVQKKIIKPVKKTEIKKEKHKEKINKDDIALNKKKNKETKKEIVEQKETKAEDTDKTDKKEQQEQTQTPLGSTSSSRGIMIENASFKYSYYTNTIVKKIGRYWQWSNATSALRAVVYFKIGRDGSVYDLKINKSSKDDSFDQNVLRAVQLAGPFAPLPEGYKEDSLGVYFEFKFR